MKENRRWNYEQSKSNAKSGSRRRLDRSGNQGLSENRKPEKQVYGKYGTLAKQYLEDKGIDWTIANLPEYLHGVDKAADELYETMCEKFSKEERFKRSADFMENLRRETEMQRLIEEEILNEIVYVK